MAVGSTTYAGVRPKSARAWIAAHQDGEPLPPEYKTLLSLWNLCCAFGITPAQARALPAGDVAVAQFGGMYERASRR